MTISSRTGMAARFACVIAAGAWLAACAGGPGPPAATYGTGGTGGTMRPYEVNGVWYKPAVQPHYDEAGLASWYGPQSRYHTTADGEAFDAAAPTAAHRTLPLPCIVEVTNLDNGRKARLRVNDRGPFARGRILDVSRRGAEELGFLARGMARVRVRYIGPAPPVSDARAEVRRPVGAMAHIGAAAPGDVPSAGRPVRVQAATFAVRANAERAAQDLAAAGATSIEGVSHGGQAMWRVVVTGRDGESLEALQGLIADQGFTGAVPIGPS